MDGTPHLRGDHHEREHSLPEAPTARARRQSLRERIPTLAVVLVVVTAVAAAVMVAPTVSEPDHRPVAARPVATGPAPPAMVQAPPLDSRALAQAADRPAASAMQQGAGPACLDCGVIESVVALVPRAQDDAVAYQMRIRMDDGSLRTVEQRGALATGSRVIVAGGSVRAVSGRPGPG